MKNIILALLFAFSFNTYGNVKYDDLVHLTEDETEAIISQGHSLELKNNMQSLNLPQGSGIVAMFMAFAYIVFLPVMVIYHNLNTPRAKNARRQKAWETTRQFCLGAINDIVALGYYSYLYDDNPKRLDCVLKQAKGKENQFRYCTSLCRGFVYSDEVDKHINYYQGGQYQLWYMKGAKKWGFSNGQESFLSSSGVRECVSNFIKKQVSLGKCQ